MTDDKIIRDAQYRKGLSIAFFNATNSAIALTISLLSKMEKEDIVSDEQVENMVSSWRNHFLEEHKTYYATVIASIGANYNSAETIEKLKLAKTKEELRATWNSISADERHDGEIRKVVEELKKQLK